MQRGDILDLATPIAVHFATVEAVANLAVPHRVVEPGEDKEALMQALQSALELPEHFGHNWDALADMLRDLPGDPLILVVQNGRRFWRESPRLARELVEVWLDAAEWWREQNVPFHLIFAM